MSGELSYTALGILCPLMATALAAVRQPVGSAADIAVIHR